MGHPIHYADLATDRVVRLFRRDLVRYGGTDDHGEVEISSGKMGTLASRLQHFSFWTYDQWLKKLQRYTTVQAEQWFEAGRRPSYLKLLANGPLRFFREYVLRLGFLDGAVGLQLATMAAHYSFMKQARLWALHHARMQSQVEEVLELSTADRSICATTHPTGAQPPVRPTRVDDADMKPAAILDPKFRLYSGEHRQATSRDAG